jgi:hypothetical protein
MQKFTPMERGPVTFQVGVSVGPRGSLDVLVNIKFFTPSENHIPAIMISLSILGSVT